MSNSTRYLATLDEIPCSKAVANKARLGEMETEGIENNVQTATVQRTIPGETDACGVSRVEPLVLA